MLQKNLQSIEEGVITKVNVGRLTNCIFVFTLLYLFKNIQVPNFIEMGSNQTLSIWVTNTSPEIWNFVNAYLIIAIIWILTFHIIHQVKKISHTFLYIHFGMLMMLVFLPVTSMLADNFPKEPLFSLFLHLNVLLLAVSLYVEWNYLSGRSDLIQDSITKEDVSNTSKRIGILIGIAFFGGLLCLRDIEGTRFLYMLLLFFFGIEEIVANRKESCPKKSIDTPGNPDNTIHENFHVYSAIPESPSVVTRGRKFQGPVGMDMLEILINGVFAFSMTLIVKNIPLPHASDAQDFQVLITFVIRVFFDAIEFVMVFIILAIIWMLSFEILRQMQAVDLPFVYLVLAELFLVVFIPVSSGLLSVFTGEAHISIIYGMNIIFLGLMLLIQERYLTGKPELQIPSYHENLNEEKGEKKNRVNSLINGITGNFFQNNLRNTRTNLHLRLWILPLSFVLWMAMDLQGVEYSTIIALSGIGIVTWLSRG